MLIDEEISDPKGFVQLDTWCCRLKTCSEQNRILVNENL